jgi:hypothetical protein
MWYNISMTTKRYTDEQLIEAVANSYSVMEVMRKLGIKFAGGSHHHISNRIKKMELDSSHFKRQAHNKGVPSTKRLLPEGILVHDRLSGRKEKTVLLRRAMLESGVEYKCACGLTNSWNSDTLTLEVDHINGDNLDNRLVNLRFMCPNCHSQQSTTNKPHKYR